MGAFCNAWNCKKKQGDDSDVRHFLRFHKVPDPKKNKKLFDLWVNKMGRRKCDVTAHMFVCSDHFFDENYAASDTLQSRLMYRDAMKMRLKANAVPNTDPSTDSTYKEPPRKGDVELDTPRSRKKRRRDASFIDSLVQENDAILSAITLGSPGGSIIGDYAAGSSLDDRSMDLSASSDMLQQKKTIVRTQTMPFTTNRGVQAGEAGDTTFQTFPKYPESNSAEDINLILGPESDEEVAESLDPDYDLSEMQTLKNTR